MSIRRGYGLVELLVTLAVSALVATALGSALFYQLRMARLVTARVAVVSATRLALHVLRTDLRLAAPDSDVHGFGRESIAARLPRASGAVCGTAPGQIWIRATGMREPDVRKDSILIISARGEQVGAILTASQDPGTCAPVPGTTVYRLTTTTAAITAGAALVFESGTYYLRENAFRFRIGAEGRQPLTEEVFQDAGSGFALAGDSAHANLAVRLTALPAFGQALVPPAIAVFVFPNRVR